MRVALDATAVTAQPSGVRTRIVELYSRVAEREEVDLTLFARKDAGLDMAVPLKIVEHPPAPWARAWTMSNPVARLVEKGGFDLFDAQTLPLPRLPRTPVCVTLHDLRFLKPGMAPLSRRVLARLFIGKNLLRAQSVVTVSKSMKAEIARTYPFLARGRVHVVTNGVPPLKAGRTGFLEERGIERPYLLCLGHLEPRKNVKNLVRAFHLFKRKTPCEPVSLVLAGEGIPPEGATWLGKVAEDEKAALLINALAVVQPSRYEGFGMGVLEALALGLPVACSRIPAHEEVAGDAALYFDPQDVDGMASAVESIVVDAALRSRLAGKGQSRAERFSWERSAVRLVNAWKGQNS